MQKVRSTSKIVVLLAVVGAFAFGQTARAGSSWTSTANATKSVSLIPPPACGGNSSIAVTAGTTVYFCYTVFNNSGVNGTYDLFDNIIGTIAQNATAPAGQPSRKWASWIAVANSTNGVGTVVNNATWTLPGAGAVFAAAQAAANIGPLDANSVPALAPAGLLAFGGILLAAGLLFLRRIG